MTRSRLSRNTESTIAPPPNQRFSLTNVLWLLDTRKDARKIISSCIFLFPKDYQTMTSGWQGAPYFSRYGQELVSKPAISLKKSWGGYRRTTGKRLGRHSALVALMIVGTRPRRGGRPWSRRRNRQIKSFFAVDGRCLIMRLDIKRPSYSIQ